MCPDRVVIVVPSNRDFPPATAESLARLYGRGLVDGYVTALLVVGDTYIDTARNLLVTHAMDVPTDPTHIFWMDDDMVIPSTAIAQLLAHDRDIVGGLYHQRMMPFRPVAYFDTEDMDKRFASIELAEQGAGLMEVDGMGLGCCLVRMDVYNELAELGGPRWHAVIDGRGEDLHFFNRAKDAGYRVWLDTDLRCGHVRREVVTTTHWASYRAAATRASQSEE
jgi:hypothetical protein